MNVLEILLNRRWILKSRDKELYYQVRDQLNTVKKFLTEKLGYQVIVNPYLIKVEKMPAQVKPWMGIQEFQAPIQYVFLCLILMFLEDKEAEEQFVLSELTEYIQGQYREEPIDWTSYTYRRHLVKVMKFCVNCGILDVNDGKEDSFAKDDTSEVLYENTGASRYFMKNFTKNIMDYTKPEDFEEDEWIDVNTDRGIVRRQRVYRKLVMSLGMYRNGDLDEDFAYVKNYRNMIEGDLEQIFDCSLQVHKNSAFLIIGETGNLGRCIPEEKTLSDIMLLCNGIIVEKIKSGQLDVSINEEIIISEQTFRAIIEVCKMRYDQGFIKTYRDMLTSAFYSEVRMYMEQVDFIEIKDEQVLIHASVGKIVGQYPKDFLQKIEDQLEDTNALKETV